MVEIPTIRICHLYPDVLNLYGDRGNTITLMRRLAWRGIDAELVELEVGHDVDFSEFDLFFIGGGQDFDQYTLLGDLGIDQPGSKAERLKQVIEDDVPVLAICGGYQLLGERYIDQEGQCARFIGAIPFYTDSAEKRMIGNLVYDCDAVPGGTTVVGFENHSGKTYLSDGLEPLGHVRCGFGNNGEDGTEGLHYRNVFATYSHGPLLPKNPAIADELLRLAIQRKVPGAELAPLDDQLEMRAHDTMLERLV